MTRVRIIGVVSGSRSKGGIVSNSSVPEWCGETSEFGGSGEVKGLHSIPFAQPTNAQFVHPLQVVLWYSIKVKNIAKNRQEPGVPYYDPVL